MSTEAIVAIVVIAAIILLAIAFLMPRMRERSRIRQQEHELHRRRERVSSEHREAAQLREHRADEAQRRAEIAEHEARREREEAQLHEKRAAQHEEGLADHELVDDDERDQFAGTSLDRDRTLRDDDDVDTTRERDPIRDNVQPGTTDRPGTSGRSTRL